MLRPTSSLPILLSVLASAALLATGCGRPAAPRLPTDGSLHFRAESSEAGLAPYYWRGRLRDAKIVGTVAGAVAWADFDGDGDPDVFVTQGLADPAQPDVPGDCGRLLRNDSGRRFADATVVSGLRACAWGMGALWEDLDGDGRVDLFVTAAGPNTLWRQREDGTFAPADAAAGVAGDPRDFSTGAVALDADSDGDMDLFVAGYIDTTVEEERSRPAFRLRLLDEYEPVPDRLWINRGDATFEPAPPAALEGATGRGLSVLAADLDEDGHDDLFVANDRDPNRLLLGRGDGTFADGSAMSGLALGDVGAPQAGMGVALGDADRDGHADLAVSNFSDEPMNLYLSLGEGIFEDRGREWGLHAPTIPLLGWSTELVDFDLDGALDLYVVHAHLLPDWVARVARWRDDREAVHQLFRGPYRQAPLLFQGGPGKLRPAAALEPLVGVWRGAGTADVDSDGLLDLLLYSSDRATPTLLLRNRSRRAGAWSALTSGPEGTLRTRQLRRVTADTGERELIGSVASGSGYLAASSLPLHFGLGPANRVDLTVEGRGRRIRFRRLPADRGVVLPPAGPR